MIELDKLTRKFHDMGMSNIKYLDDTTIEFTIDVCEVGDEFGINGDNEAYWAYPEIFGNIAEYERVIKLTFYCVSNLNKQIDFENVKELNLRIIELKIENEKKVFFICDSYNNDAVYVEISFESKGFDLNYLKDKEKKV